MSDKASSNRSSARSAAPEVNTRDLTSRIEQHDLSANKELTDLRGKMSAKEYAHLLKTVEATNLQDRESDKTLPKLLIVGDEKKASFVGVDYKPIAAPVQTFDAKSGSGTGAGFGSGSATGRADSKDSSKATTQAKDDGNYSNTAIGREKLWNAFFGGK